MIPKYGTAAYRAWQYKRRLEENRGYNFEYWSPKHDQLLENGWETFIFQERKFESEATSSVVEAKEVVNKLRSEGNFARIIAGMYQNQQRQKMFTVIFKPKKKKRHEAPTTAPAKEKTNI